MATTNPIKFLLNQADDSTAEGGPLTHEVDAPAFSLTKVLATAATVLTPLAAVLAQQVGTVSFSAGNVVVLILGVLGFMAIASSADVLGRCYATAARVRADADTAVANAATATEAAKKAAPQSFVTLTDVPASVQNGRGPKPVTVVGVTGSGSSVQFLVADKKLTSWRPGKDVTFI